MKVRVSNVYNFIIIGLYGLYVRWLFAALIQCL